MRVRVGFAVALFVVLLAVTVNRWAALTVLVPAGAWLWSHRQRGPRLFPAWMRDRILAKDRGRCRYCGVVVHKLAVCPYGGCDDDFQADHVKAWHDGGSTTLKNSATSCRWCNLTKGAMSVDEFAEAVRARVAAMR